MNKAIVSLVALAAVLAVSGLIAADSTGDPDQTLAGSFQWVNADRPGKLRAEFTATGEDTWDVVFKFRFRGRPHAYAGTAEGSLSDGELKGEIRNENRRRTFAFEGRFADGAFNGTHTELRDGDTYQTGTLSLNQSD